MGWGFHNGRAHLSFRMCGPSIHGMVRRMAYPVVAALVLASLTLLGPGHDGAWAQAAAEAVPAEPAPAEAPDLSLSPECRVPGSKLYTIASLRGVKEALKENRAVK